MIEIFNTRIAVCESPIDFEISIDETLTSTSPEAHYFVASELSEANVAVANIAPRFCGEFQKGIDYIGDAEQFKIEYTAHEAVARHFGHRISVHSGSDKFTVFPYVGSISSRGFHLKTAGTNWLEAVRVIAAADPALYREMHSYALSHLGEARKYYHIRGLPENIAPLDSLPDERLPSLMDLDDSRQVIHISYGILLTAKNDDGSYVFKDRIYKTLDDHEDDYADALVRHIGRHLKILGIQ